MASSSFTTSHSFDAPRAKLWEAWTDQDALKQWFAPQGCSIFSSTLDLSKGGTYHYGIRTPIGTSMWGIWTFREIVPQEKLVTVASFSDEEKSITRHPLVPTWPLQMLSTMTLAEHSGKTQITITWQPIDPTETERHTFENSHPGMQQGWFATFAQLEAYLKK